MLEKVREGPGWLQRRPAGPEPETETQQKFGAFAIFFPAVTGIRAGISMSGSLARPRESLPLGTMGAIGAA
jgi:hypothetical protein